MALLSVDLDGDARRDLVVVLAFTSWGQISSDRVEAAVSITEIVPAVFERREARAFLAREGGYVPAAPPFDLGIDVHAAAAGPPGTGVVLLGDGGVDALRYVAEPEPRLERTPLLRAAGVFDGSRELLPGLRFVSDLDADDVPDLVFPGAEGLEIHRGGNGGFGSAPAFRALLPGDRARDQGTLVRFYPLPDFEDVDGDRRLDLVLRGTGLDGRPSLHVARGLGECRFGSLAPIDLAGAQLRQPAPPATRPRDRKEERPRPEGRNLAHFGDLDGDGRAEVVTAEAIDTDRGDLKQAKEPRFRYRIHRVRDGKVDGTPAAEFTAAGWTGDGEEFGGGPSFRDLDGDSRKDLVAVRLDFSLFQAVRVLTSKRISIELDFGVWSQGPGLAFREVKGLDLSEKLTFDLNDLRLGRIAQFAGDFDGDGRIDFVHLGRGSTVTVHRGRDGATYPARPDVEIRLDGPIEDLALVRIADLDGDGRDDLAVTRLLEASDAVASTPARLELRLSGGAR
ncbi:MAG TPA: FG-GAP-like repeat-containing protein [Candidatus Polarisedimenticolaceae bacterium]